MSRRVAAASVAGTPTALSVAYAFIRCPNYNGRIMGADERWWYIRG